MKYHFALVFMVVFVSNVAQGDIYQFLSSFGNWLQTGPRFAFANAFEQYPQQIQNQVRLVNLCTRLLRMPARYPSSAPACTHFTAPPDSSEESIATAFNFLSNVGNGAASAILAAKLLREAAHQHISDGEIRMFNPASVIAAVDATLADNALTKWTTVQMVCKTYVYPVVNPQRFVQAGCLALKIPR